MLPGYEKSGITLSGLVWTKKGLVRFSFGIFFGFPANRRAADAASGLAAVKTEVAVRTRVLFR